MVSKGSGYDPKRPSDSSRNCRAKMSSPELKVRYIPDDQWMGELEATVLSGDFAGKARAWFNLEDLKVFLNGLRAFPLDQSNLPMIEGSYGGNSPRPDVRVKIGPHNNLGLLRAEVDLVTKLWTAGEQSVITQFFTEYGLLSDFATEFAAMLDGKREAAVLAGRDRM
jgi:hypothetical protein